KFFDFKIKIGNDDLKNRHPQTIRFRPFDSNECPAFFNQDKRKNWLHASFFFCCGDGRNRTAV
ncbi:MAG: hypothetical protein AAB679_00845, partial [Patescibacteria group bacterium]